MGLKSQYHCHSEGAHVDFGKMNTINAGTVNDGTVNKGTMSEGTVNDGTVNVLPPPHFLGKLSSTAHSPGEVCHTQECSWERMSPGR